MSTTPSPLIGILLIGHTPFASALLGCASHVFGCKLEAVAVLDVTPDCDPAKVVVSARKAADSVDQGRGVLVLTDLFGATPGNIAARLVDPGRIEILTGVSLPMLLRALTYRDVSTLDVLIEKATTGASAGVMKIASTAPQHQGGPTASQSSEDGNLKQDGAADALARLRDQQ